MFILFVFSFMLNFVILFVFSLVQGDLGDIYPSRHNNILQAWRSGATGKGVLIGILDNGKLYYIFTIYIIIITIIMFDKESTTNLNLMLMLLLYCCYCYRCFIFAVVIAAVVFAVCCWSHINWDNPTCFRMFKNALISLNFIGWIISKILLITVAWCLKIYLSFKIPFT